MQDDGKPSPLDDVPDLTLDEGIYYKDFNILGSERVSGMGVGYIPITRITQYAKQQGVHNISLFERIITAVDNQYVSLIADRQKKKSKKAK